MDNGMEVRYFREGEATDAGTFPLEQIQVRSIKLPVPFLESFIFSHFWKNLIMIENQNSKRTIRNRSKSFFPGYDRVYQCAIY